MTDMIRTSGLVKRYGKVVALDGLDLAVPKGNVLGLLGPNGAGKTTAVRILTTLLDADEGSAEVAGLDVRRDPKEVRKRIGLSGQNAAVDEHLTGFENLDMVGRLYWWPSRRCCSWTSPPRGWTPGAGPRCGRTSWSSLGGALPSS